MKKVLLVVVVVVLGSALLAGQAAPPPEMGAHVMIADGPGMVGMQTFGVVAGRNDGPVKGVPFCATVVTDHTQTFADGNKIHTADNSLVCRDSEGRTRREADLKLMGPMDAAGPGKMITISDPNTGVRYMLDTNMKIARKMPMLPPLPPVTKGTGAGKPGADVMYFTTGGAQDVGRPGPGAEVVASTMAVRKIVPAGGEKPDVEQLGDQTINGIHVTGTRVTTTIPAGKMGNEQPIKIVSEDWYSPELKETVMTKHSDPWAGELTTQFTNVNTAEPDPSLFTVPSDYKVVDMKPGQPVQIQIQQPAPAAQ